MGKEWLYWIGGNGGAAGKSTKKGKSSGRVAEREAPTTPGCMCAVFQLFDLHHFQFALNHHTSNLKTDSFLQFQDEPSTVVKGVEAPRNSLELEVEAACLSSAIKEEEILNIPMGIQIKTTCENRSPRVSTSSSKLARGEDLLSECSSSSPGARTPNLVARLMGLDLLPESGSPSFSSSRRSTSNSITINSHMNHPPRHSQKLQEHPRSRPFLHSRPCNRNTSFYENNNMGSLSLPETPRISSATRSDVEHRLSLQMNRDNIGEELEFSADSAKMKMARRRDVRLQDENRSPGHYARNIVKQVKESVSRKVGLDITNTLKSREQRRDDHVVLLKPKKPSPVLTRSTEDESCSSKQATTSCSPRFRFLDPKNKAITSRITKTQNSQSPRLSLLSPSAAKQSQVQEANVSLKLRPQVPVVVHHQQHKSVQRCKKAGNERFNSRLIRKPPTVSDAIRNKKEEPFIRTTTTNKANSISEKKCRKTPLSNELLSARKDSSLPLTKLRDKQVCDALSWESSARLSRCTGRSYCQEEVTHTLTFQENIQDKCICNGTASTSVDEMEFQYVKRILKRTGLDKATPVSLAKWFSPSHPLDPSIFHYIELFHPATIGEVSRISLRSNRKLIFQLVDELLVEILKPYINWNPWISPASVAAFESKMLYGSELIEELCGRIKNFPSANCQVLEDIDSLIDKDLRKSEIGTSLEAYEEVGERIASEIERDIIESLVHETATTLVVFGMAPLSLRTLHSETE